MAISDLIITPFDEDMEFTSGYDGIVKRIVSDALMVKASARQDMKEATDFVCRGGRIASRVRRPTFAAAYPSQFTMRFKRSSGVETEYSKVLKGFADMMFYGHAVRGDDERIWPWYLIDLHVFRRELQAHARFRWDLIANRDGKTEFMAFDLRTFENVAELVVASAFPVAYDPSLGWGRM